MSGNIIQGGWLSGKKTHLAVAGVIITAVIGYLAGEADLITTIEVVFGAITASAMRAGVAKSGPNGGQ